MGRPRKNLIPIMKCLHCGEKLEDKQFYKSNGSIYAGNDNYIPVCKDCIKILYQEYKTQYINQFSVLGSKPEEYSIEKLAVKRVCMTFDIYYSDSLFEAAVKNQEKFPNLDMITAYIKMTNLRQNKNKTYDTTIFEENLSQELIKSTIVDKVRVQFDNGGLYQDIYDLCLKLLQSLKKNCNINAKNNNYSTND